MYVGIVGSSSSVVVVVFFCRRVVLRGAVSLGSEVERVVVVWSLVIARVERMDVPPLFG